MKTAELRERLLVALVTAAKQKGLGQYLKPAPVADEFLLPRAPGQLRLLIQDLENRGLLQPSYTMAGADEGGLDLRVTAAGIEEAEDLLDEHPDYAVPLSPPAPASDRWVTLADNQRSGLESDLASLRLAVAGINSSDEEDREIALSEIASFEATVVQSRVSVELIDRFVNKILKWLMRTFADAAVAVVAEALIRQLLPLV